MQITPHVGKIQDKPRSFYQAFNLVVCGLDNIEARRWINSVLHSFVERDAVSAAYDHASALKIYTYTSLPLNVLNNFT